MTQDYRQVRARIRSLEAETENLRREELQLILAEIRQRIREYGITQSQLFGPDLSDLVQYRHPDTGQTWNGVGRPPNWIRGQNRSRFLVK